jgi:hypothetical protein
MYCVISVKSGPDDKERVQYPKSQNPPILFWLDMARLMVLRTSEMMKKEDRVAGAKKVGICGFFMVVGIWIWIWIWIWLVSRRRHAVTHMHSPQ